jgi:hypothetical protein
LVPKSSVLLLSSALVLAACGREEAAPSGEAGAGPAPTGVEATLPSLKPGRWRTTTTVAGAAAQPAPTVACIADKAQKANVAMAERLGQLSCSERWVRQEGDAIVSRAVCEVDGATQTYETRATGDFSTDFFINSVVTRDPPQSDGGAEFRTTVHSRWMGEC